jgi:branched-chain amino acid transport system substrate-binding protein
LIGSNAGPSPIAGEQCHENFFSMSWQNDQTPEAMGKHMQDAGVKSVYLMAPNYQAGKDMLSGFKRYFKGEIAGEVYTKLGQSDFQAELSVPARCRTGNDNGLPARWYGDKFCQAMETVWP